MLDAGVAVAAVFGRCAFAFRNDTTFQDIAAGDQEAVDASLIDLGREQVLSVAALSVGSAQASVASGCTRVRRATNGSVRVAPCDLATPDEIVGADFQTLGLTSSGD
jgi:hypothetical protein